MPGDKSISHRAAIVLSLANGRSSIANYNPGADCDSTIASLRHLGVPIEREGNNVVIAGAGMDGFTQPKSSLDCGNSGSTMRLLAGVLAGQDFVSILTGDESLRSRPMQRIIEPLEMMGARIGSNGGKAPLRIEGRRQLSTITYELPVASAQVKSCILIAGLNANGRTEVIEEQGSTRDHTERMLRWLGVTIDEVTFESEGIRRTAFSIENCSRYVARDGTIPGDISAAAYFLVAAALVQGSLLTIEDVGLNPSRTGFLDVLKSLGIDLLLSVSAAGDFGEPFGEVGVKGGSSPTRERVVVRAPVTSQVIDEIPLLAVLGSQLPGGFSIRDASELRAKESDRIRATVVNLRAMGVNVEEHEDGLTIPGPIRLRGARLDAQGDHRIAMAFSIAALIAEDESEIADADCVRISFPNFFEMLESVVER